MGIPISNIVRGASRAAAAASEAAAPASTSLERLTQAGASASAGVESLGRLPVMNAKAAVKLLRSNDFELVRQRGSHATYAHVTNGRQAVVPMHNGDLPKGTLRSILQQAGLGAEALGRR